MFIKELTIYLKYLEDQIAEVRRAITEKQKRYLLKFAKNLSEGVAYYETLFTSSTEVFKSSKAKILYDFLRGKDALEALVLEIEELEIAKA